MMIRSALLVLFVLVGGCNVDAWCLSIGGDCAAKVRSGFCGDGLRRAWACNLDSSLGNPATQYPSTPLCGVIFCATSEDDAVTQARVLANLASVPPSLRCVDVGFTLWEVANYDYEAAWNGSEWGGICISRSGGAGDTCKRAWESCTMNETYQGDCCPGLQCDDLDYEVPVCCVRRGQPCSSSEECCGRSFNINNECVAGVCVDACVPGPHLDGEICFSNYDCVSCVCDPGYGCSGP